MEKRMIAPTKKPRKKIAQKQLELRNQLWPELTDGHIWVRQKHDGYATIPRTMTLILSIMDDLAEMPVGMTYLELWCRSFNENFVNLSRHREIAFHAGCDGQRGERTWREKIKKLAALGFILIEDGPSGDLSYGLILNPYLVLRKLHGENAPGLVKAKYNALVARAGEIGADDFNLPDPWSVVPAPGAKWGAAAAQAAALETMKAKFAAIKKPAASKTAKKAASA
jgi:hypothetical protein